MFILELTLRAWAHAEENKRRTLQRNDVAAAITTSGVVLWVAIGAAASAVGVRPKPARNGRPMSAPAHQRDPRWVP